MTTPFTDGVIAAIRLGAIVGLCICGFLLYRQWSGTLTTLGGCDGAWNCEDIFKSKWGSLLGIPVTALAAMVYVSMFVLSLDPIRKTGKVPAILLGALGVALLIGSLWFVGLQMSLKVTCTFCNLAQFVGVVIGGVVLQSICRAIHFGVKVSALPTFALALVFSLVLIGGHFSGSGNDLSENDGPPVATGEQRFEDGFYRFPNLGLSIERGKYPTIGNPKADKAVVVLIDYSTISSQLIHQHLTVLVEDFGDSLAIILIPVPLDKDCNEYWDSSQSANACQMAAYAYAAWEANPRIYLAYHNFLMLGGSHSQSGSISGVVWGDANSNGVRDPGEKGIANVKIDLGNSVNISSRTRHETDESGAYVFGSLPVGVFDLRYQLQVADSNFADDGVLSGMIMTAGGGESRNSSDFFELMNTAATLTGKDFGFVAGDDFNEAALLKNRKESIKPADEKPVDPLYAELLRLAGDDAESITRFLPDFALIENADKVIGAQQDWRDSESPVVVKLLDGTQIYGDLRHLSPALPKIIFGADQVRNGAMTDESPPEFARKVAQANDLQEP